jgi:general L-amino acid transport system permease protein
MKVEAAGTTPRMVSAFQWLRVRLFSSWSSSLATLGILYLGWRIVPPLIEWAFIRAVWSPENANLCRSVIGHGACWALSRTSTDSFCSVRSLSTSSGGRL